MTTIVISFCILIFTLYPLYGSSINDTIRLDEVIVTGSMPKVNLHNLPMIYPWLRKVRLRQGKITHYCLY